MTTCLWVEDFGKEGTNVDSDLSCKKLTARLFMSSLKYQSTGRNVGESSLSEDELVLQEFLRNKCDIYLEFSLSGALKFIKNKLELIDFIILDIWLPEKDVLDDEIDVSDKDYSDTHQEVLNYKTSCEGFKTDKAGYYIFVELVVNLGYPKDRIIFYTNHGEESASLEDTFKKACIQAPLMFMKTEKDKKKVDDWLKRQYEDKYLLLRRAIINIADDLINREDHLVSHALFKSNSKVNLGSNIDKADIIRLIQTLAEALPQRINEARKKYLFRLFITNLVQFGDKLAWWDKYVIKESWQRPFAAVYVYTRHWLAHDPKVFMDLDEHDVAFYFFGSMRLFYKIHEQFLPYESLIIDQLFPCVPVNNQSNVISRSFKETELLYNEKCKDLYDEEIKSKHNVFVEMTNRIQEQRSKIEGTPKCPSNYFDSGRKRLYRCAWHLIATPPNAGATKRNSAQKPDQVTNKEYTNQYPEFYKKLYDGIFFKAFPRSLS